MKKLLYVLSLLIIASMVLTACGGGQPAATAARGGRAEPLTAEATEPPAEATEAPAEGEPTAVPTPTFPRQF